MSPGQAFLNKPASVQVQSVLFNNKLAAIERVVASLARSVELARESGYVSRAHLAYGDGSSFPCLPEAMLLRLRSEHAGLLTIGYDLFDGNIGSAAGHNRLASAAETDFLLVQNPDVVVSPRLLENIIEPFARPGVGITEAKQLPIEHPKDYHVLSGETSWATTACAMTPLSLFRELNGFDAETFFLYCDDVDYSWRVRLLGYKVIFQPGAVVFHDKHLSNEGLW